MKFIRKPAPATIKLNLASGRKPSTTKRRYKRYVEIENSAELFRSPFFLLISQAEREI